MLNNDYLNYMNGNSIATELTDFGVNCTLEKTIESAVIITHIFRLVKMQDILNLPKALKVLEVALGKTVTRTERAEQGCFGLEIEKDKISHLTLDKHLKTVKPYNVLVGEATDGQIITIDFNKTPHLLIAGCTGSGKSVLLNNIVKCIIETNKKGDYYKPLIIDAKKVGFTKYENEKFVEVATSTAEASIVLKWAVTQMYERYEEMRKTQMKEWQGHKIIILIDELADLILTDKRSVETFIVKLAQMGRACGIHLVIATQRPTVNIVTGLIKANIPDRIALRVSSARDSLVIMENKGAEKLKGKGDCYAKINGETKRVQCFYSE